ncbi:hypothetical protein DPMN_014512 [Dreissena polymorpha]|uniref:Uncharacterized protein n=1 Tax=Dreissena polymorpha TaxID=45954 RepID=A0A9D4S3I4_DREPO|nr:hypothetical protein DPMN_014512 [Dreissena polymorpha]
MNSCNIPPSYPDPCCSVETLSDDDWRCILFHRGHSLSQINTYRPCTNSIQRTSSVNANSWTERSSDGSSDNILWMQANGPKPFLMHACGSAYPLIRLILTELLKCLQHQHPASGISAL